MKRWWLVIVLLLSLGINVGILAALATGRLGREEARPRTPFEGPMNDGRDLARRMGLDEEGGRNFRELHRRFQERTQEQRRQSMDMRRQLLEQLTAEEPDREKIEDILVRLSEAESEMERALVETTLSARQLLDPEQERRYLRFLASRMMRRPGATRPSRPPVGRPPRGQPMSRDRRP